MDYLWTTWPLEVTTAERLGNLWIDTQDATYFYFWYTLKGWTNWRIKRMKKSDFAIDWAEWEDEPATAWSGRTALTYSINI